MKNTFKLLLLGLLLGVVSPIFGQRVPADSLPTGHIRGVGKYFGDSLVLRFVPTRPGTWAEGNKLGYLIERQEIDTTYSLPYVRLTPVPLKPWPLDQWKALVGSPSKPDRYAAITAQSLYGKPTTPPTSLMERADLLLNNYSNTLLSAEISPKVAAAAGLRWTDTSIKPNKLYRYRIWMAGKSAIGDIDTTYVTVGTFAKLPVPVADFLPVQESEKTVELRWSRQYHEAHFSAYYIERSDDGGQTFKSLTDVPYIQMDSYEKAQKEYFYYSDSVATNYKPYHYRLIGITTFGEMSTPSRAIVGMGRDRTPPKQPQNVKTKLLKEGKIEISWNHPPESDLKGFIIGRSSRVDVNYQPISQTLPPNARSFIDDKADPRQINYYIVAAVDTANNGAVSLYTHGQFLDTIPPAIPTGLRGAIDTNGVVTLRWKLGPEKDIKGYKIAFSNSPNRPFILASNALIQDTIWRDTLNLRTLTKKIYYKIMVIDLMDNYSSFSAALELTKPDKVPPVSPQFREYKIDSTGIKLIWIASTSQDVKQHIVQRRLRSQSTWENIATITALESVLQHTDKSTQPRQDYDYQVLARDESGLFSSPSEKIALNAGDFRVVSTPQNLNVISNAQTKTARLTWQKTNGKIVIYRAVNGRHFSTIITVDANTNGYTDGNLQLDTSYEYTAKLTASDGRISGFAPIIKVLLK